MRPPSAARSAGICGRRHFVMSSGAHSGTFPPGGPGEFPRPVTPRVPGSPGTPPGDPPGPVPATRVWMDPQADWQNQLYARLLDKRIVMATGNLDDDAATRLSAQLLTLDAEGDEPIR